MVTVLPCGASPPDLYVLYGDMEGPLQHISPLEITQPNQTKCAATLPRHVVVVGLCSWCLGPRRRRALPHKLCIKFMIPRRPCPR